MNIKPRSAWQKPAQPVTGPLLESDLITELVVHYPGADWADLDFDNADGITEADSVWLLRSMQNAYLTSPTRGYSLGYSFAIFPLGDAWEIRGLTFRNAANKGRDGTWNRRSVSVLIIVDEADPMTPAQLHRFWGLVDELEAELGRPLTLRRHGDGDATACPGDGITAQLAAGRPKPTPPTEEDMPNTARRIRLKGTINEFLVGSGPPLHLTSELAASYSDLPVIEVAMTTQFARTLSAAGFTPDQIVGKWEVAK